MYHYASMVNMYVLYGFRTCSTASFEVCRDVSFFILFATVETILSILFFAGQSYRSVRADGLTRYILYRKLNIIFEIMIYCRLPVSLMASYNEESVLTLALRRTTVNDTF